MQSLAVTVFILYFLFLFFFSSTNAIDFFERIMIQNCEGVEPNQRS